MKREWHARYKKDLNGTFHVSADAGTRYWVTVTLDREPDRMVFVHLTREDAARLRDDLDRALRETPGPVDAAPDGGGDR